MLVGGVTAERGVLLGFMAAHDSCVCPIFKKYGMVHVFLISFFVREKIKLYVLCYHPFLICNTVHKQKIHILYHYDRFGIIFLYHRLSVLSRRSSLLSWRVVKMSSSAFSLVVKRSSGAVTWVIKRSSCVVAWAITMSSGRHVVRCKVVTWEENLLRNCKSRQLSSVVVSCCHFIAQKSNTWQTCLSC